MNSLNSLQSGAGPQHFKGVSMDAMRSANPNALRMEPEFWDAFLEVCHRESLRPSQLISLAGADETAGRSESERASALRLFLITYIRENGRTSREATSVARQTDIVSDAEPMKIATAR